MRQQKDSFNQRLLMSDESSNDDLSNTIQPLGKRNVSFPLRGLRTWIFSLLALVFLPIGIWVFLIGIEMEEDLRDDWDEVTAEVIRNDETGVEYRITEGDATDTEGTFPYLLDDFLDNTPGELTLNASLCDFVSRFIVPKDRDSEFSVWVNPDKSSQHSCVPITRDFSSLYIVFGAVLTLFSGVRIIRTINGAALRG